MLHAPFNFVPLSEKVYFPEWAGQISHDIPFRDGRSGILRIRITAQTPIFIRNGHTRQDKEDWTDQYISFSQTPDGHYFIPATSLKGMIRNIVEIASFGKMSHVTNDRYSLRDLHLKAFTNYFRNHEVHCGWMTIDRSKDVATITDNGIPRRISAKEIDNIMHIGLERFVKEGNLTVLSNRYAKAKYDLAKGKSRVSTFRELPPDKNNTVDVRKKVVYSPNGKKGTIVFTGQPGKRKENPYGKSSGKWFEFVFFDEVKKEYQLDMKEIGGVYQDFCFIYADSEDWKYLKRESRIPVFFTIEDEKIQYMGLSYLFRLPTKKHIKEFLNAEHQSEKRDFAECMFGTTTGTSLKGRIQFSHAFCKKGKASDETLYPYMGSPKPTYYPIYTQQQGYEGEMKDRNGKMLSFKTFLDDDAKLRGWKRYPVRNTESQLLPPDDAQMPNTSPFKPLSPGSEFECAIRYHNLREIELGALVYALHLNDNCMHSLGFCKPYGYGVVKIDITNIDAGECSRLRNTFIDHMCTKVDNYKSSPQIRELNEMMTYAQNGLVEPLSYMKDPKTFGKLKNQNKSKGEYGEYQRNYSELKKKPVKVQDKPIELEAEVTIFGKGMYKAKLVSGKDTVSKQLDMRGSKEKLKIGNRIIVKQEKKGKDIYLVYVRKK